MGLIILRNENTFTVEGKINEATVGKFKTQINLMLNSLKELTIDIDKVTEIDAKGVEAFKVVYKNAKSYHKSLSIIGNGCDDIYEELFQFNIA